MNILISMLASVVLAMSTGQNMEPQPTSDGEPVKVMVVGSWHMAGSNANMIDVEGVNVLTSERQAQFEALIERLAEFEPTIVAVEMEGKAPNYIHEPYEKFEPSVLSEKAGEWVQLGYRLAHRVGLENVHAIDEKPRDGDPDYFPIDKLIEHIEKQGRMAEMDAMIAQAEAEQIAQMARFEQMDIGDALAEMNAEAEKDHLAYYTFGEFDAGEDQPGSELQAYWFMRNAKIFAKLMDITKPGDRVVLVYGNGHKYWLDHFADKTPGYELVDSVPYLRNE